MKHRIPVTVLFALAVVAFARSPASAGEIHRAAESGDADRVAALLHGNPARVGDRDDDATRMLPIHAAAAAGHADVVRVLLDAGAQVDAGDVDGSTALHVAALRGHLDVVDLLLACGADPAFQDDHGAWSLSFAVSGGDDAVIARLIEAGAPLDLVMAGGYTLAHYAALRGKIDLFDRVVAAGVRADARTDVGSTPLHWAANGDRTAMIAHLVADGADTEARDEMGTTPMLSATVRGRADAVAALIAQGANVDAVDVWEKTVLCVAADMGREEIVRTLLAAGADANRPDVYGTTPLMEAAGAGHAAIVRALLDAGADTNPREARCGRTALHRAILGGYGDVVDLLTARGASLTARDGHDLSPLLLAERYGHTGCVALLTARGAVAAPDATRCPAETGCLAPCPGHDAGGKELAAGDARIWYLGHSGFAVQTRNNLLVFDYFTGGREPDRLSLRNGHIDPAELAGMPVTVFVSHEHRDHFDPAVLEWAGQLPRIRYVMGCDADAPRPCERPGLRTVNHYGDVTVRTIESNDSGLGFLVQCDGVTIFHAGDHANRQRDFSGPYAAEIDWLARMGAHPDIAFMPVTGCGFGDQEAVRLGVRYGLEKLRPRVFIPMHGLGHEWSYREFVDDCRTDFPRTQMVAPLQRGDHYDFRGGRIS